MLDYLIHGSFPHPVLMWVVTHHRDVCEAEGFVSYEVVAE